MTAPEVTALAAALVTVEARRIEAVSPNLLKHIPGPDMALWAEHAEAIIAALAAQGWRMYRNPTVSEMSKGMEDAEFPMGPEEPTMTDPDFRSSLATYAALVKRDGYLNLDAFIEWLRPHDRAIEQAAVRAALEGWADRWEAEALTSTDRAVSGVLRSVAAELRHEVARLAALE